MVDELELRARESLCYVIEVIAEKRVRLFEHVSHLRMQLRGGDLNISSRRVDQVLDLSEGRREPGKRERGACRSWQHRATTTGEECAKQDGTTHG
jgi:hypothetical protein